MATNEGYNLPWGGARVFDDDVSAALGVADVGDNEGSAGIGGTEWEQNIEDMACDAILLGNEIGRVVLDVAGLADDLREEGDEGVAVERTQ